MTSDSSDSSTFERQVLIEKKNSKEIPRIWKANPSYKDTNMTLTITRIILLSSLSIFFVCTTYLLTSDIYLALGVGVFILTIFLLTFYDKASSLFSLF